MAASIWGPQSTGFLTSSIFTVENIAGLRLLTSVAAVVYVLGYYDKTDGGGGLYCWDPEDLTSLDNGGTVIIAADGSRWKLINDRLPTVSAFGGISPLGLTDISSAVQAACNDSSLVIIPPGVYIIKDVTIPNGCAVQMDGAYITDSAGAQFIFKLTGYNSKLLGGQISSAANCAQAAVVVDDTRNSKIASLNIVNSTNGIRLQSSSNGSNGFGCTRLQISDVMIDTFTGKGLDVLKNVSEINATNLYCDAGTVASIAQPSLQNPRPASAGVSIVSTGSVVAFGGHIFTNTTAINCQDGWSFTDVTLIKLIGCISDSASRYAYAVLGASSDIRIDASFAGTCARAVYTAGTSQRISTTGLQTFGVGEIPSFGGSDWYTRVGMGSPFYELESSGTSKQSVDAASWTSAGANSHKILIGAGTELRAIGAERYTFFTTANLAINSGVIVGPAGPGAVGTPGLTGATELSSWVLSTPQVFNSQLFSVYCNIAPGVGQSITYTLQVNGVSTGITATISGAATSATGVGSVVGAATGDRITITIVSSATATPSIHRGYILGCQQPG